jgi:hypothetical protein
MGVHFTRNTLHTESAVPEEGEPDKEPKVADVGDDNPIENGAIVEEKWMPMA